MVAKRNAPTVVVLLWAVAGGLVGSFALAVVWEYEAAFTGAMYGAGAGATGGPLVFFVIYATTWLLWRPSDEE